MDDIYRNLSMIDMWSDSTSLDETSFQVTEIREQVATGKIRTKHTSVNEPDLIAWLSQDSTEPGKDGQRLVARFAWLDVIAKTKAIKQSESIRNQLLKSFGVELAHGYARSCLMGATAFPRSTDSQTDQRSYCVCHVPKLAAIWSHRSFPGSPNRRSLIQGLIFAQDQEKQILTQCLQGVWTPDTYRNPMFPALVLGIVLGAQIDYSNDEIKKRLREVEGQTGYHDFKIRDEKPKPEKLTELSAKSNGFATKLASVERKSKGVEMILTFIDKMADDRWGPQQQNTGGAQSSVGRDVSGQPEPVGCSLMRSHARVLKDRREMQALDTDYTLKRVNVQISAIWNLMALSDSDENIKLSRDTHKIATFTHRDAASMKTLAVVTMFFLPGSFISALFSTPCFEWDRVDLTTSDIGVPPTPQFRLYWAITIPLTLMTFFLYFLWLYYLSGKQELEQNARPLTERSGDGREKGKDEETGEPYTLARSGSTTFSWKRFTTW